MHDEDLGLVLYSVVAAEDELGTGIDIYTTTDDIYQVRFGEEAITSLYREDDEWTATVHNPVDENGEGYNRFHTLAERCDEAYGTDLERSVMAFHNELTESGVVEGHGAGLTLNYRPEPAIDVPDAPTPYSRDAAIAQKVEEAVTGAGILGIFGGIVGGVVGVGGGFLLGDPVLGVMVGSGILGGGGGALGGWAAHDMAEAEIAEGEMDTLTPESAYNRLNGDEAEPSQNKVVGPLFDRLNERNRLEVHLEEVPRYDDSLIDRYDTLEEEDLDDWRDTVLNLVFRDAHQLSGVVAHQQAESYKDTCDFLNTVFGETVAPRSEPSIYTHSKAFQQVMEEMTHDDGVFSDADILVTNLWTHPGSAEDISAWLEEEYLDVVKRVGQERALEGGE